MDKILDILTMSPLIFLVILPLIALVVLPVAMIITKINSALKSPFSYPYFVHEFDVSGKRQPAIGDYLDTFLNSGGFSHIQSHQALIERWKVGCALTIEKSILKKRRRKQYENAIGDTHAFTFLLTRSQTRYQQRNYVKYPYQVKVPTNSFSCNYDFLVKRYRQLEAIGFECTLRQYHTKNQRKLATRELREKIMQRDNYTCQLCGKYMPDEVGLQVDHIIPVSKGGKTLPSNLRVLCSKCNGAKSNKLEG